MRDVASMERRTDLDWLRGLMLVLMTMTHLPTWFSSHAGQPFGFVSAAEGFVFLSAYLVGSVYGHKARTAGLDAMRRALLGRTLKVYAAHAALLLFLLLVLVPIAVSRDADAITGLASYALERPRLALASGLVLAYNPPLLDILPMYVLFLLASPALLAYGMRRGFGLLFAISALLWLYAQYDGGAHVYRAVATLVGWPVPYGATGAFAFMAWQLLWLVGLRIGVMQSDPDAGQNQSRVRDDFPLRGNSSPTPWPRFAFPLVIGIAAVFFVWRHIVGQTFGSDAFLNALFDKWRLGPLRLLNFAVLALIVVRLRPTIVAWAEDSPLATLGRASLIVFSAHLLICLALLTILGGEPRPHLSIFEAALLLGTLVVLYGVAVAALAGPRTIRAQGRTLAARIRIRV